MNGQLYTVLHVSPMADATAIRTAYRRAALAAHPDKGGSEKQFHSVAFAFETLSNAASREAYDRLNRMVHCPDTPNGRRNKRSSTHDGDDCQKSKRQADGRKSSMLGEQRGQDAAAVLSARKAKVLRRLQSVLQSLEATLRREVMASMEPHVRRALLVHMQTRNSCGHHNHKNMRVRSCHGLQGGSLPKAATPRIFENGMDGFRLTKSGVTGVHRFGRLYRAFTAIANMEIYTRLQPSIDVAIEDHIVLVQLREAILLNMDSENKKLYQSDEQVLRSCRKCLADNYTSEKELQLRARIRIRATRWMGPLRVCSPTLPFAEAIALRSKLLSSRRSSWESFRGECISLLQRERCYHLKWTRRTHQEATVVTDKAWANAALKRQIGEAARKKLIRKVSQRVGVVLDLEERRAAGARARLEATENRRIKAAQRQARQELKRWLRRSDLTTEEIIRGPPAHLRQMNVQKIPG